MSRRALAPARDSDVLGILRGQRAATICGVDAFVAWAGGDRRAECPFDRDPSVSAPLLHLSKLDNEPAERAATFAQPDIGEAAGGLDFTTGADELGELSPPTDGSSTNCDAGA